MGQDEEFTLTACLPNLESSEIESKIKNVQDHCGWNLKVSPNLKEFQSPDFEELMTLRMIDPDGYFRY